MNVKISPFCQSLKTCHGWYGTKRVTFFSSNKSGKLKIRQQYFSSSLLWLITCNLCLRPISNVHLILRISLLNWSDQRVLQNWCQSLKRQGTGACWVSTGRCTGIKWKAPPGITYRRSPEAGSLTLNRKTQEPHCVRHLFGIAFRTCSSYTLIAFSN